MTEDEQLEAMKKWWKKYGNIVVVALSVVLFSIAATRYWNWYKNMRTEQASVAYEQMMVSFSNQNNKRVMAFANELIKNHKASVYADVAHMTLAKLYVSQSKLDEATNELKIVASNSIMPSLKQIAKIDIARIMSSNKSYKEALNELATVVDATYMPVINELKGDIYGAQGQYQDAINAYQLAMSEVKNNGIGNLFLEMKTNELAMKNKADAAGNTKAQAA
jgi:predicted negative regulator of RcsB-dependent stress response